MNPIKIFLTIIVFACVNAHAIVVFQADFGSTSNLNPANLLNALNNFDRTQVGSWSNLDESGAAFTTDGVLSNSDDSNAALILDTTTSAQYEQSIQADFSSTADFTSSTVNVSFDWALTRLSPSFPDTRYVWIEFLNASDEIVYELRVDAALNLFYSLDGGSTTLDSGIDIDHQNPVNTSSPYDPADMTSISLAFNPTGSDNTAISLNGTDYDLAVGITEISSIRIAMDSNTSSEAHGTILDNIMVSTIPEPRAYAMVASLIALGLVCLRSRR